MTLRTQERRTALLRARVLAVQTDRALEEMRKLRRDVTMDFVVAIDLDEESGRPKKVVFSDVKPEDQEAVASLAAKLGGVNN